MIDDVVALVSSVAFALALGLLLGVIGGCL